MPTLESVRDVATPLSDDFLDQPVQEAFAWREIIDDIEQQRRLAGIRQNLSGRALYLVVFESTREPGADPELIAELDDAAHEEAKQSPELLHYYADTPDEKGRARSWCLWTDDKAAREAIGGPAHHEAMSRAREFYGNNYAIKLFSVIPHDDGIIFYEHEHPTTTRTREEN